MLPALARAYGGNPDLNQQRAGTRATDHAARIFLMTAWISGRLSQRLASRCDQGLDVLFRRQLCNLLQFVEVFRLEIDVTP